MSDLVIGVDGGGTKTAAWIAPLVDDGSGTVLGRGLAGPGNPRSVGFETAQGNIEAAIAAAFAEAQRPRTTVAAACFGLAGSSQPDAQSRLRAWAMDRAVATKLSITTDADLVLGAQTSGIALLAGTGSLCLGRNSAGETARSGGWGYLLGDEGSAYAVAVAGLRAAVRSADGRGPQTELLPAFLENLGVATPWDLIMKIYGVGMTRVDLASLANVVFEQQLGDDMARRIVTDAAAELAEMVGVVARRLRMGRCEYTLRMAGGMVVHMEGYAEAVMNDLAAQQIEPDEWRVVEHPVLGALELARELARS